MEDRRRKQQRGDCGYCKRDFSGTGMLRHLTACRARRESNAREIGETDETVALHHLRVQFAWDKDFWLDLEVMGSARLIDLDRYLRFIWLECCFHLSMFTENGWGSNEVLFTNKIEDALQPGARLTYTYDFGTETELSIRTVSVREGSPLPAAIPIRLMTRNGPPDYCIIDGEVINSPRLGLCGYEGPTQEPVDDYPADTYLSEVGRAEMDKEFDDYRYFAKNKLAVRSRVPEWVERLRRE